MSKLTSEEKEALIDRQLMSVRQKTHLAEKNLARLGSDANKKKRAARTRRLIQIGAIVETAIGRGELDPQVVSDLLYKYITVPEGSPPFRIADIMHDVLEEMSASETTEE